MTDSDKHWSYCDTELITTIKKCILETTEFFAKCDSRAESNTYRKEHTIA